ncbi:MAG: phenylacetate--CoA ligase family protein [Candidatus Hodarchaeota archaeon]
MSYSTFAKHVIYPILEIYRRKDTLRHFRELEKTQWLSVVEVKKIQWKKLKSILEYAYAKVPFYQRVFKTLNITPKDITTSEDFRKLPVLYKEDIRNNISHIVSSNYKTRDLIPNSTGGSTGVNLNFFNDRRNSGRVDAIVLRNERWAGLEIGDKNAKLWGSPFDISLQSNLENRIHNKLFRTLFLSSYNLSGQDMFLYARKLLQYKPKVIVGYPSPLYHFAKFLQENGIKGINPKSIISSAEVLYDYQKELIESVFQCKVFNRYGCNEFSTIAQECSQHLGMHINAEHVYVECLKRDGEPVAPGEIGELAITDLDNYGMPFIRYKIGDIGVLSDRKCNCGRGLPMLEKIEGRTFDIVVGTNGRAAGGMFWTLLLRTAIEGIKQFQVVQESVSEINIKVVTDESFEEGRIDTLVNEIREYLGEDMKVNFQIVDKLLPTKSGKFRFIISKISHCLA